MAKNPPVGQHFHNIEDLPIGTGPGRIPTSDMVPALAGAAGGRAQIILRPAGPADPGNGVYTTWATAHAAAAALALPGTLVLLILDGAGAAVNAAAGVWDIQNILIQGRPDGGLSFGGRAQQLITPVGCSFTNWWLGADGVYIQHLGNTPLFSISAASPRLVETGNDVTFESSGTAPVYEIVAGGIFVTMLVGTLTTFLGIGSGSAVPPVLLTGPAVLQMTLGSGCQLSAQMFSGLPAAVVNLNPVSGITDVNFTQAPGFTGTLATFNLRGLYTPGNPADWIGAPTVLLMHEALDRLAQAVVARTVGGPI